MAKRPCARPGCQALVLKGYCDECAPKHSPKARAEEMRVRRPWDAWYKTAKWVKARAGYLRKHPICADPFREHGARLVMATDLDHIIAVARFLALGMAAVAKAFWDFEGNVQGLCHACHSRKTATEDGGFGCNSNVIKGMAGVG